MKTDSPPAGEPSPFARMKAMAAQIVAVPKEEVDRREAEWRKGREAMPQRKTPTRA